MKKHIAIFIPSLEIGGAQRTIIDLANALAGRENVRVDLLVLKKPVSHGTNLTEHVNLVDLNRSRVIFSIFVLVSYLRRAQPDVIMTAMSYANVAVIIAHMLSRVKSRLIVTEHTVPSFKIPGIKHRIVQLLMRHLYPFTDRIVAVSEQVRQELIDTFSFSPEQISTVHNPINVQHIETLASLPLSHPMMKTGVPIILAVGRLDAQKDYPTFLHACALLRADLAFHAIILGDGPLRPKLEALARRLSLNGIVEFRGSDDNPYKFMKNSDVFVLSSTHEGFGNVIVEAMACGLPVISTSDPADILENEKWGDKVPPRNPQLLSDRIRVVLSRKTHVSAAPRVSDFEIEAIANQYYQILTCESGELSSDK